MRVVSFLPNGKSPKREREREEEEKEQTSLLFSKSEEEMATEEGKWRGKKSNKNF